MSERTAQSYTSTDHAQRADESEGVRAPMADDLGHAEHSIFDGAGNETVVVTTRNEDGRTKQGTGHTSEAAMKDAKKGADPIGDGFGSNPRH